MSTINMFNALDNVLYEPLSESNLCLRWCWPTDVARKFNKNFIRTKNQDQGLKKIWIYSAFWRKRALASEDMRYVLSKYYVHA